MSDIRITADEHHGHKKIIEYCRRPFRDVTEQTEAIIQRHNAVTPPSLNYLTIHVGDWFWHTLSLGEALTILGRLNGRHAFIYGNHDELIEKHESAFAQQLDWIKGDNKASGVHRLKFNGNEMTFCHYAMRVWNKSHKGSGMLFGHSHNELPVVGKSFDIGVDGHDFTPWTLEEIDEKLAGMNQHHVVTPRSSLAGEES